MRKITRIRSKIYQGFEKVFFLFLIDANSCPAMGPILTGFCLETSLGHRLKQHWRKREIASNRDIKPPWNEEFVMEMKGITLYIRRLPSSRVNKICPPETRCVAISAMRKMVVE